MKKIWKIMEFLFHKKCCEFHWNCLSDPNWSELIVSAWSEIKHGLETVILRIPLGEIFHFDLSVKQHQVFSRKMKICICHYYYYYYCLKCKREREREKKNIFIFYYVWFVQLKTWKTKYRKFKNFDCFFLIVLYREHDAQ